MNSKTAASRETSSTFPPNFIWGSATSAYQIEGAYDKDGRGMSIWDTFCEIPDKIVDGSNGDVACDHYDRMESDVALMAQLGLKAYRFSISWPRIVPLGEITSENTINANAINRKGIDFYNRLIDSLLENGIEPWVCTIYFLSASTLSLIFAKNLICLWNVMMFTF